MTSFVITHKYRAVAPFMPGTDTITEPRSSSYTTPGTHTIVIRKPLIGADAEPVDERGNEAAPRVPGHDTMLLTHNNSRPARRVSVPSVPKHEPKTG